ncbi:MAG: DUF4129 domain-containing protein [Chloroflexi bacterium]|nr:DUF4129 domain-containing protein [Chloroflexota bacterium]
MPIRPVLLLVALACLLLAAPVRAQGEDGALTLEDYLALAAETEAALEGDGGGSLPELAGRWESVSAVRLANGATVAVDHSALSAELRAEPPDTEAIAARLQALKIVAARWPAPAYDEARAAEAEDRLEAILARPAFQWQEEQPGFWERLWERVLRFLFDLLPWDSGALDLANILLAILGGAILALVLALAARSLLRSFRPEAVAADGDDELEGLTAEQALQEAQSHSQEGDYRRAVRYLYLSTLLLLEERGLLRFDRSRTNREYLRSIADRPELFGILQSIVDVFDRVWYGFQPLDDAGYSRYLAQVNELKARRGE